MASWYNPYSPYGHPPHPVLPPYHTMQMEPTGPPKVQEPYASYFKHVPTPSQTALPKQTSVMPRDLYPECDDSDTTYDSALENAPDLRNARMEALAKTLEKVQEDILQLRLEGKAPTKPSPLRLPPQTAAPMLPPKRSTPLPSTYPPARPSKTINPQTHSKLNYPNMQPTHTEALAFLKQVKLQAGEGIYRELLAILRAWRDREIPNVRDLVNEVHELFMAYPALQKGFERFLPPRLWRRRDSLHG